MREDRNSLTIIITAYNEAENIEDAVRNVIDAVTKIIPKFKMIIMDDGSIDDTGKIAENIASKNKNVRVIHNKHNLGLGCAFRRVIHFVDTTYLTAFPGDNDVSASSLIPLIKARDQADLITAYMKTDGQRTLLRRVISRSYVLLMNLLFGLNLHYYNGPFICKTQAVTSIKLHSTGLDIYSELKVRLIKKGYSFKEVTFRHTGRKYGKSTAVGLKSIVRTIRNTINLYRDLLH